MRDDIVDIVISDYKTSFITGFVLGGVAMFLILYAVLAFSWSLEQESPKRDYGMTCIELNGDFISCNWDEWDKETK